MLYQEIDFRGKFILQERQRVDRERLRAASFTAWQMLQGKVEKLPTWGKYLRQLGLSDELPRTKEELEREADQAMKNAQRIIDKATGNNGSR